MTSFGYFIKTEREKRSWTQTEFGAMIGINSSAISRIENGTQNFSISKLATLAQLFKMKEQVVRDLFFGDKFAKEAYKYNCSETVFSVAEDAAKYFRNTKVQQGKLEL